ncbi:carbohydrate ABC transporter permease [Anaerocolumna sp. MB42-C2]|uniref:carbohydrate ABC transporter permease n=1 Tax=Anaerocolumna sp. MB42-C2 TaxID=3070997 RepID=UPI0027DECED1|nr:carbohydrate ABC transporter permease [Anaerocolumna sp. MB42-C2]WMJ89052.1 carbohydrate ABC transporter permease [Anaerocolumna sp. MB42-C2]
MLKAWKMKSKEDIVIDFFNYLLCIIIMFVTIYPFYYILVVSFNEGVDASLGGIYWWPRKWTLDNYQKFFSDVKWLRGLGITVLRTILGTFIGILFTTLVAYGLSFKELVNRKLYMVIIIISMYFSGGIIPYYTLLKELHLIDTFAVYIIPGALNTFFILVGLSFFSDIPSSLRESAKIDGASEWRVFRKIILPISTPFIATCILFVGVGHWNNWYDSAFFVRSKNLKTLSYLMMEVINSTQVSAISQQFGASSSTTTVSIQTAAMIIATLPIICVYPFLQRYFVTGIMVGSVKE